MRGCSLVWPPRLSQTASKIFIYLSSAKLVYFAAAGLMEHFANAVNFQVRFFLKRQLEQFRVLFVTDSFPLARKIKPSWGSHANDLYENLRSEN